MKVSIILPARNEEMLIKDVVVDIQKYLKKKKYTYEILVVVNGSHDKTEDIVKRIAKRDRRVKITHSKPGYGHALKKGLKEAKGDFIVIYNVDFYDLKLIDLVSIDLYGKDLIIGSKRAPWSSDNRKSMSRKLVTQFFNIYLKIVHGFNGSDTHGIKALKGSFVRKLLPKCKTTSGIFDTELVLRIQKAGGKVADFPVVVEEVRPSRFTKRLLDTPKDILDLFKAFYG